MIEKAEDGSEYYRGYAVDLVDMIFKKIKKQDKSNDFKYEFYVVEGLGFGKQIMGSSRWNGLLGEIIDHVNRFILQVFIYARYI